MSTTSFRRLAPRPRRPALAALLCFAGSIAGAQTVDDVYPLEPDDGARVGPKPLLTLGVEGTDLIEMKFRIVLSADNWDTEAYVFDQIEDKSGWAYQMYDGAYGAQFRVKKPLEDGEYEWRADAWNGVDWVEGESTYRLDVDSVPPADVSGLSMTVGDEGEVRLEWDPVTLDQEGRPEYVETYHVYRYHRRSMFFVIRPFWIGSTEFPRYLDDDPLALDGRLVFYKITAEDAAGNEPERRF